MKLSINRNSWHYKVAHNGNFDQYGDASSGDLCGYFWGFVWGCVWPLLITLVGALFASLFVLMPLIGIVAFLFEGLWFNDIPGIMIVADIAAALIFVGMYWLQSEESFVNRSSAMKLAKAGYRGWKEKTCVLVEIN